MSAKTSSSPSGLPEDQDGEVFFRAVIELLENNRPQARELLLQRLAKSPEDLRARLLYSKALYLDHFIEHAVRELIELKKRRDTPSVRALLASFGAIAGPFAGDKQHAETLEEETKTVGEIDFDLSVLDEE